MRRLRAARAALGARWARASLLGLFAALGASSVACAGSPSSAADEGVGVAAQPILGGTVSDASQDAVVLLIHYAPDSGHYSVCTGTLLTPRLVLTARHCLANADPAMACAANGRAVFGGKVAGSFDPSELWVYAGADRPSLTEILPKAVRGLDIIDEGGSGLCNGDIGLLLLADDVPGAKIAPVRFGASASIGEHVTFVGWGTTKGTTLPLVRQQRTDGAVLSVGPSRPLGLGSAEILVGEGTCDGDSGSPALSEKGAVIGALSRGGNGTMADDGSSCDGGRNIYTATAGFKSLLMKGYARAGQDPWVEGRPNPTLARTGESCTSSAECQSNDCDPEGRVCSEDCSYSGCFEGFVCGPDRRQCVPAPPAAEGGCSAAKGAGTSEVTMLAVAFVALVARRRLRRVGSG